MIPASSDPCLVAPAVVVQPSVDQVPCSLSQDSSFASSKSLSSGVCSGANLSFSSCNITSLKKNYALLDFADVIGLQESRHTALGVSSLAAKLRILLATMFFLARLFTSVLPPRSVLALSSMVFQGALLWLSVPMLLRNLLLWVPVIVVADFGPLVAGSTPCFLMVVVEAPYMSWYFMVIRVNTPTPDYLNPTKHFFGMFLQKPILCVTFLVNLSRFELRSARFRNMSTSMPS